MGCRCSTPLFCLFDTYSQGTYRLAANSSLVKRGATPIIAKTAGLLMHVLTL
jgi:hypothetical protein